MSPRARARLLAWTGPVCLATLLAGCQTTGLGPQPPNDYQPAALWSAIWQGDRATSRDLALAAGWESTGSIEGERYRQAELLAEGRRAELMLEAEQRLAEAPFDPDRAYLHARLLQDPIRLVARFEELAARHPRHAWIRLGAAGSQLQLGETRAAAAHLRAAPDWPDAREFRALIEARVREQHGEPRPWRGLRDLALVQGSPSALAEMESMARSSGDRAAEEAAAADRALRAQGPVTGPLAASSEQEAEALALLMRRLHAQLALQPELSLPEVLARLDGWAEHLGLPAVWGASPRYRLPFGAGLLLRPERDAGALTALLERQQRVVLIGGSWLQGTRAVELQGVRRLSLPWPGLKEAVEIVLAESARGETEWVSGGAVFRGFFVRRDLNRRTARAWERRAQRITAIDLPSDWQQAPTQGSDAPDLVGGLPEDLDLGLRLRAQILENQQAEQATWEALLLHEAGHLPDVLPIASGKDPAWVRQLGRVLGSWLQDGWPLSEWEYRAQLRALAEPGQPRLLLAQIVETAQDPSAPYFRPYRRLLQDLVQVNRAQGGLPLAQWHSWSDAEIQAQARALLERQGIDALPRGFGELMLEAARQVDRAETSGQ